MKFALRPVCAVCILALPLMAYGCNSGSSHNTAYSGKLHQLVEKKALPSEKVDTSKVPDLRWPDFSDYQSSVSRFYDSRSYAVAWTRDGVPTPAASAFIKAFQAADEKGLIPEDYDASRWPGRVQALSTRSDDAISLFDVAMTVNVMRYISDLHVGRVNPQHFNFAIDVKDKKYDLATFVSEHAVDATDVPALITSVEPDSEQYRKTEQALARYIDLAKQQQQSGAEPLPTVANPVSAGGAYSGAEALRQRLQLEGDAEASPAPDTVSAPAPGQETQPERRNSHSASRPLFTEELSDAVKHYQHRHGLAEDGKLTPQTIRSLNVPLTVRVAQLEDSLERWRWLPDPYLHPRLMVNLPEFVLRGYGSDNTVDFTMKVIVGQVKKDDVDHQTPVFTHMMRYIVFRPYWNVPVDIAQRDFVPRMGSAPGYVEGRNYEVINRHGAVQTQYNAGEVNKGALMLREKPGPRNSLGLIKFMFPNQYDIYLHSTPSTYLFARTRRDFSHGCIRVQKPADLAVWVLQNEPGDWDLDKVNDAMNEGPDNKSLVLKTPLPIVIFYLTATVDEDGNTDFFDDIYGYDAEMEKVFAKGPPYPVKPEPVVPKTKPGDTA